MRAPLLVVPPLFAQIDVEPDGHVEVVVLNEISRVTYSVEPGRSGKAHQ